MRYVFGKDKKLYPEGEIPPEIGPLVEHVPRFGHGPAIFMDTPDFVSPIDGTVVKGRRGVREHCHAHNVVPTAELKGLPTTKPKQEPDRAAIREELKKQLYR